MATHRNEVSLSTAYPTQANVTTSHTSTISKADEQSQIGSDQIRGIPVLTFEPTEVNAMPEISAEGILSRGRGDCLYLGELGPATIWKSNSETAVTLDGTGHAHVYQHGVEVMKEGDFISVVGGYAEETPYPCDADRQAFEIYIIESVNP